MTERKRRAPDELKWVLENMNRFSHLTFFNEHTQYSQRKLIRRFNIIVNDWIVDESKKKELQEGYEKWMRNKNEVKEFWIGWNLKHTLNSQTNMSTTVTSASVTEIAPIASSSSSSSNELLKNYLSNCITTPVREPYLVDGFNITQGFYNFQMTVKKDILSNRLLTFESHLAHILSLSSILLLCRRTNDPVLDGHFNGQTPRIAKNFLFNIGWGNIKFPRELIITLLDVYHDISTEILSIDVAVANISNLSVDYDLIVRQCLGVFWRLLQSLPRLTSSSEVKERHLCCRYLQPILQGMFDQRTSGGDIMFNFTDQQNLGCTDSSSASLSSRRPDGSISWIVGNDDKHVGYAEVKPFSAAQNHYKINVDLVRLGIFGKNAIDTHSIKNAMVVQAVGMNLTFYIVQRTTDELYTMFELDSLRFPASIDEMSMMFGLMDRIINIIHIFRTHCLISPSQAVVFKETLKSPVLRAVTCKNVNRKRKNHHEHSPF